MKESRKRVNAMPTLDAVADVFDLARTGDPGAIAPLIEILRQHPKLTIRAAAAHLLGQIGDRRAISALETALNDTSDGGFLQQETPVSESAEEALLAIYERVGAGVDDVLRLARMLEEGGERRQYTRSLLISLKAPIEHTLLAQFPLLNILGQSAVLTILGQRRFVPALNFLMAGFSHPSPQIRNAAVNALGELGDVRAFDAVLGCLNDPDHGVRRSVHFVLRQVSDERHVPVLERILASGQFNAFERRDVEVALQAARERKAPED